ncbi:ATP-binding protein [Burkholderia ubonensis]|uniref:ATP-binding protein n=1 Tax=Burkholderia ubonensis TaxID=101571 RepID=UPI00075B888E|nr:ATP-binding protein [Burkholderia ubonensis]KWB81422.1 transposase [Burkholderia ubonensis]
MSTAEVTEETVVRRNRASMYSMYMSDAKHPKIIEAEYYQGDDLPPEYRNNPLISALGPLWDSKSIMHALSVPIIASVSERSRSEEYRLHVIGRLSGLVVPVPASLEVCHLVQMIVRQNYVGQSIFVDDAEGAHDRYRCVHEGRLIPIYDHARTHAYCAGIFGLSGAGKSNAIEDALRLMPRAIHHSKYGMTQVVSIKVDCPTSASLKDIIKKIIGEYDRLLDTHYLEHVWRGATVEDLASFLYRIVRRHRTGLIIIDEIQNALRTVEKSDPLFDFFVGLTNGGGVPIIVIGTPKSERLFRKTLRSARRISSHGVIQWCGMQDDRDWNRFCDKLQKYQWLRNAKLLSLDIRKGFYFRTQGLPGIAVPLYQLSQYAAIYTGIEEITKDIIRSVAEERMASLPPILEAIRSRKKARMAQYEDLLGDTLRDIVAAMEAEAKRYMYLEDAIQHDREESAIDAVSRLLLFNMSEQVASHLVSVVQKELPAASTEELAAEAMRRFYLQQPQQDSLKRGRRKVAEAAV